jgi:CPA2 family monovalent cation:H+ antiporter-2
MVAGVAVTETALVVGSTGMREILVVLGAAGLVIPAFARLRITPVIGFILVGILVGPAGLGEWVRDYPWLRHVTITNRHMIEPFAEFGIILLLFSIGLELSFKRLWQMRKLIVGLGGTEMLACAAVIAIGLIFFGQRWQGAIGLGMALALSSTALVLPLVGTSGPVGQRAFAMLLFEDLALVPIIFILGAMAPHAGDTGWEGLLQTAAWSVVVVPIMLFTGRLILPLLFAQAARTKSPELFMATSLLAVIGASLITTGIGLSPIVGALLAGVLIAETDYDTEVEAMMAPFKGLALGVFLISVGMAIDMVELVERWSSLLVAVVAVLVAKTVITGMMLRIGGSKRSVAAETSLLMASPSETTLIVLSAASSANLISHHTSSFWQMVTAIGLTVTPLLAMLGRVAGRYLSHREIIPTIDLPSEPKAAVILGFGRVGHMVAQMLDVHGRPYRAIDADPERVAVAREQGFKVIYGDVSRQQVLDRLVDIDPAGTVILTMDDPVQNVRLTEKLRARYPDLTIISRARDARHAAELYRAGASDAVPETLESSLQLSEAVLVDLGVAMGPVIASIHEKRAALRDEIKAHGETLREPPIHRRRLREAKDELNAG